MSKMPPDKMGEKFYVCSVEEFRNNPMVEEQKETDIPAPVRKCSIASDIEYKEEIKEFKKEKSNGNQEK